MFTLEIVLAFNVSSKATCCVCGGGCFAVLVDSDMEFLVLRLFSSGFAADAFVVVEFGLASLRNVNAFCFLNFFI